MPEQTARAARRHHRRLARAVVAVLAAAGLTATALGVTAALREHPVADAAASTGGDTPTYASSAPPVEVRAPWRPGAPRWLRLPSLRVSAPVVPVRAPGRTLVPPRDPQVLGWWADGARPGSAHGSVVIAGHSVHGAAKGALEDLRRLEPGAEVVVATRSSHLRYVVQRVQVLGKADLSARAARLFRQGGAGRLVLVTCADWDGTSFLSNVVVTARPAARARAAQVRSRVE